MRDLTVDPALLSEFGGPGAPVRWDDHTAPEIPALVERIDAVIIPCGALEQHGPHMPLCVDWLLVQHVAESVSALTGVPAVPPVAYGVSGSHGGFPGTIGLRPETFQSVIGDLTDWLYRSGVRQFILLNGHAWNFSPLEVCADKLRTRYDDVRVRAVSYVESDPAEDFDEHCTHGRMLQHASYLETSSMLYVAPELVKLDRAPEHQDWPSFWDYRADQVSETGVWGRDVPDANPEIGERFMQRCIEATARAVRAGIAEPFARPSEGWRGVSSSR